ncbi:MAG TPA: hypothetical protein VK158_03775 [Acidobacteriota bacterium]|nr:hypothetical protein [Acidobacteriota bacterium]
MEESQSKKNVRPMVTVVLVIILVFICVLFFKAYVEEKANQKTALSMLSPEATAEQRAAHISFLQSIAVHSTIVDIRGCTPDPLVTRFKLGDKIWFTNKDSMAHTLSFDKNTQVTIEAGASLPITFDMWTVPGVRKYSCDSVEPKGVVIAE